MGDVKPNIIKGLLTGRTETRYPQDKYQIDPCGPDFPASDSAEMEVLFPKTSDSSKKTVPLMGGSIVKISLGKEIDTDDEVYKAYYRRINDNEMSFFNSEKLEDIEKKSTSSLRVAINKFLVDSVSIKYDIGTVPKLYLSTTTEDFSNLEEKKDSTISIFKNAGFAFIPSESILEVLKDLAVERIDGEDVQTIIGGWTGLSGKTYKELHDSLKSMIKNKAESDSDMQNIIMDFIPFINMSSKEISEEQKFPILGGYFTIVGKSIYLKMPDISGIDSAGYGDDYVAFSGINFLFQLIGTDLKSGATSIKNIEIKKVEPIYSGIIDVTEEEYDIRNPSEFYITLYANKKPEGFYLSPAIQDTVKVKNDLLKLIKSSQSGSFIEYSSYPNPFVSIFKESIVVDKDSKNFGASNVKEVDEPYLRVQLFNELRASPLIGLSKIRNYIDKTYNRNLGEKGPIGSYLNKIFPNFNPALPISGQVNSSIDIEKYFKSGFPIDSSLTNSSGSVIGQSLTMYEFVGNLSRENLILHNGEAFDDEDPSSSGKIGNNYKYFKKNFIANSIGLCQNYRPRVFSTPESFIPSTWIKASKISEESEGVYKASFSANDFLDFYTIATNGMKFVAYAYDGENQITKVENGYIKIAQKVPEILSISPRGILQDGVILKCDGTTLTGSSKVTVSTNEAKYVTSVTINGVEIQEGDLTITPSEISFNIPCDDKIIVGKAEVILKSGDLSSSPGYIYVSNVPDANVETTNVEDLPKEILEAGKFSIDDVDPKNLKILGQAHEIPISYIDPRSRIIIKSSKKIFKDGLDVYLYLGFESEEIAKKFSQKVENINNVFIAKDFNYKLSDSIGQDFYRKNKGKAYLYFPGYGKLDSPIGLLTSGINKAYFMLSTSEPDKINSSDNIGKIELGKSSQIIDGTFVPAKKPFFAPPTVIGMAASYDSGQFANHMYDFIGVNTDEIFEKIVEKEGIPSGVEGKDLVDIKSRFKKLIIMFYYRDIKKYKSKDFALYIKGKKVTNIFSSEGIKRASDLYGNSVPPDDAKNIYYFSIKKLSVNSATAAEVRVDINDRDFLSKNTSQNKYIDYSIRVPESNISLSADPTIKSIFIKNEIQQIYKDTSGYLFGSYEESLAFTGFFAKNVKDDLIIFDNFPGVSIESNISGYVSNIAEYSDSDNTISLSKDLSSAVVSNLPNSYFTIKSSAEISSRHYIKGDTDYLIFLRFGVLDICKLAVMTPNILDVEPKREFVPGDIAVLIMENIQNYFTIEIAGVKAKIVSIDPDPIVVGRAEVRVIVPENVPSVISKENCGALVYNGDQVLGRGINQLGKDLVNYLEKAIGGLLGHITEQFEKFKEILEKAPLKFIGKLMDKASPYKNLITSFCDFSFKITLDLKLQLDGFSQLLIPIKVIFCIIDVICNLFNPFQLPLAIIRLFECLYDLILMLPQISIPVMLFSLLLHLLDFLECLIVKITDLITAIILITDALTDILEDGSIDFRDAMVLEELLLKYVISLEADLDLMEPIVQILSIFLQLLGLTFRFPCAITPDSVDAPCGMNGFELGAMISGLVAEPYGSAPHVKYKFKKEYLIPVAQPFTKIKSEQFSSGEYSAPSYTQSTQPPRGAIAFDGSTAEGGNIYDISYFNPKSKRKKSDLFDPNSDDISSLTEDTTISLKASYTKRKKEFSSEQSVIFKFADRTWQSFIDTFDRQVIDEYQNFDVPLTLFKKDGQNLKFAGDSEAGNFYSMIDSTSMLTDISSDNTASVKPLILDIVQDGVTVSRRFDTIPAMVILDDSFNVYFVEENGIIFDTYKEYGSGNEILGVSEIRATIISQKSAERDAYSTETESYADEEGNEASRDIFFTPQLYFVDTRVAAESIQAKCETASINQLPFDLTGDGGAAEAEKVLSCINDFLKSIKDQTSGIKNSLSLGKVPERMSQDAVNNAYIKLVNCTKESIDNLCSIVVNPLNTSFKLLQDDDETPILPDPISLAEAASNSTGFGPVLTGAREYAGGIGDAAQVTVGNSATIELIPRDSYDNEIYYDLSTKSKIKIISDTTSSAVINVYPTDSNPQNYWIYNSDLKNYVATIRASNPGIVKIKAEICGKPVEAITYSDLVPQSDSGERQNCVSEITNESSSSGAIPLGALSRIERILTITFVASESEVIISGYSSESSIITEPQLFGTDMEN